MNTDASCDQCGERGSDEDNPGSRVKPRCQTADLVTATTVQHLGSWHMLLISLPRAVSRDTIPSTQMRYHGALLLLAICSAIGFSESTNIRQDLAPRLEREQRSIMSSELLAMNMMLPLLTSAALNANNADKQANLNQRQIQNEGAGQPAVPGEPTAAASPLTQLLPFLLGPSGGFARKILGGGSGGSFEVGKTGRLLTNVLLANAISNALAQTLATTTATTTSQPPSANLVAGPGRRSPKKAELRMTNVAINRVTSETDPKVVRSPATDTDDRCSSYVPRSQVCNDLPVDKILALKNAVVVFKGRNVYRVRPSGEPFDLEPTLIDEKVEPLTAAAAIGDAQYVFQGDKYTKYDSNFRQALGVFPKPVSEGFPGVLTPVDGVFKLNNHTYVFVSGTKFVYFQPDANPQVDPRYSPQYLDNIPGAPATIDSVFTLKNRK
ncbi:hypothetical protein RvY_02815 [Ramazzottius varieornatus]|uniref:Uncharacterized protein n=1 Tax=Ramazzottius varieornatus TaxID=947166 RepID=A0A1D1UPS5_RAMVA|nr:hypothetical protein RvY_02815 [Ramazzottius varieornatus]